MKGGNNPLKLYLLDANEQIIDAPPTKDVLSLIQDLKLKDTDTIEGALVVSKRYTSIMDNVRYIAASDRDNDHAFYLYRKTMAEVQDRELIFDGKESFWDDLTGSYIKDKRPDAMLAPDLVKLILDGTRWNVDFVDSGFTETLDTNFYYQSRSDALSSVMSAMTIDIVPMINIEGNTITRRYVNLYLQAGGDNGRRFVYGKNALSVVKKTDDSQVFTALVGRGKSIEQTTTDTDTGDTTTYNTPKINFADVEWSKAAGDPVDKPKGQEYVEWPESTKLYGYSNGNPRIGIVDFDNDDDPAQLLKDTWAQLQTTGIPSVQFGATVGDVGYLDKGETVTIVNYVKGIAYKTRVTELKWNRLAEAKSQLTIGDKLVQNANERMASIATQQSSTVIQAATQTIAKQVANLVTVTNSLGVNVSWSKDGTLPFEPKEGDIVYIRNDDGTITMKSYKDGQWVIIIDDTTGQQIQKKVDAKLVQLNADMSVADANLQVAQQDIADLQVKLKANDDTQAQLKNDLSENSTILEKAQADIVANTENLTALDAKLKANDDAQTQLQDDLAANTKVQAQLTTDLSDNVKLVNANKESVDAALVTVNKTLTQAKTDAETAVKNADLAVTNAQSAIDASGLATQTANAANDAATAAKNLATSTANSFATVQSQAATAASDAADALGQANTAIGNAADALNKVNGISVGGTNLLTGTSGTLKTVTNASGWNDGLPCIPVALTVDSATTYTARVWLSPVSHDTRIQVALKDSSGKTYYLNGNTISAGTSGYSKWTATLAAGSTIEYVLIVFTVRQSTASTVSYKEMKFEKGSVATDWSPSPEDVQVQISNINGELSQKVSQTDYDTLNQTVSDNSAQLKLTATSVALETQSNRVDTISGKVDTNTAAITTANGEIELKASNSRVDTLSNTVEQQGIDLKAAQGELALKITQSDLTNGLSGYATQTWAQNQINLTANGLNAKLSQTQTQLDGISIGGRNLLTGTSDKPSTKTGDKWNITVIGVYKAPKVGQEYTIYVEVPEADHDVMLEVFRTNNAGARIGDNIGKIPRIKSGGKGHATFTWPDPGDSGATCFSCFLSWTNRTDTGTYSYCKAKLEIGNTPTDWTPAPEDTATYTDTKVAELKLTVDGFSTTFAKKTDLETTASNLKVTSDGLNLVTAVTGTNGENVTQVIADVNNIKTTMTGANGYTTRLQTLEGFQTTATDNIKGLKNQQTTLAGQYTSIIGDLAVFQNLFADEALNGSPAGTADRATVTYGGGLLLVNDANYIGRVYWTNVGVASKTYSFRMAYNTNGAIGIKLSFYGPTAGSESEFDLSQPDSNAHIVEFTLKCPEDSSGALSIWVPKGAHIRVTMLKMYNATGSVASSQITQLKDQIDLRTTVDGKVTAALNLSNDGGGAVTIRGASLYVTAASHFDDASIQSAAIANLDATKITSGSISSDRLATTKLNADNITSGSISAERLATTKLNASNITSGSINAGLITTGVLSADMIVGGTFDASKMTVKNINAGSITSGSIATALLASTKINADNITSGSISAERLAATKISATNIVGGTFDAGTMTVKHLSADMIVTGTLDVSKLTAVKNFSASNIIGGTLDASTMTVKKLSATSITGGTLNAAGMDVINLNASAITTGTIKGANLAINLNTGQVVFQSGQIHSTTDNIDINIDKGYMSVADSHSRVLLKGGQLQFIQPQLFDLQTTPYLSISNDGVGSNWAGATIVGRDSIMLANSANVGSDIFTWELGKNTFSGLISGKNSDGNWEPTILGGAERGVVIVGGSSTLIAGDGSPYIRVGSSIDGQGQGNRIYMRAEYFHVPTVYQHTSSGSANVIVKADGALVRTSSATKYKSNIERFRNTDMGETLLTLPQAHWYNKQDMQRYTDDPQHYSMPELDYGMIAEDLAAAGLEDLVVRGDDGQLEDIRYDRIGPALLPLLAQMKQEIEELKSAAKSA